MPLVLADRVRETTTTTGQGTVTLAGAVSGFQSFSVIGNGNTTYYTIAGQGTSEWEVGIGTYTASGTTLSRDTVLASSAGAPTKTTFSAGTKDVFVTYTAARSVNVDGNTIDTFGMGATQGDILYASAADTFSRLAKSTTATRYLANTGTNNDPAWAQINLANGVTGSLPAANGGTGQTSYVIGDLLFADSTTSLTRLADVATGNALISGGVGVAPSYGKIGLTTHVSGTLPIANGGSGQTTAQAAMNAFAGAVTSGQYLRGNGTNVVMSAIQAADVPTLNQNTTGSAATFTSTTQNSQFNSVGVGTAGSGTAGEIRATNNITAFFSSDRTLKENIRDIPDALNKVCVIGGKLFDWTDDYIQKQGGVDGYFVQKSDFGVIAQDVEAQLPVAVRKREDGTLAVDYEKMCALAFAAIAELRAEIDALKARG